MNRNVQKVIERLIQYGSDELSRFDEQHTEGKFDAELLAKAIILLYFKHVSLDGKIENDKNGVAILFLDPAKIFAALNNIRADIREKVSFLEWYLTRFVNFYIDKSLEDYEKMGYLLLEKSNNYLNIPEAKKRVIYEKSKKSEKKEQAYIFYKELCESMKKLKENGILYTQQYLHLFRLGMSVDFIENVKIYQLFCMINNVKVPKEKKKEPKKINNNFAVDLDSKIQKNSSNVLNENKHNIPVPSVSHRSVKEKLSKYVNLSTMQNKTLIEGESFLEVDSLLHSIYPETKVIFIEKRICANNEKMKQEMYMNAMHELLLNAEDLQLFLNAKASLANELIDSFFSPYLGLVQKIVSDIDSYICEYLALQEKEKISLKEEYTNLIVMSLEELRLHLDFLPFDEESPIRS